MTSIARHADSATARIALGPGAPAPLADFLGRAGLDVLNFGQRANASLYVDFVGARPPGIEVLSIEMAANRVARRAQADIAAPDWMTAASLIISIAMRMKPPLLSANPAMHGLVETAVGVASNHFPVVISGEAGTGKYSLARLIHRAGRCAGPIVTVNCASFGGVDVGALIGALPDRATAAGPAMVIYFDELAELSDAAQAKLLDLMQFVERIPEPGHRANQNPAVRVIGATTRALPAMVARGDFRRDLYWRLNVFALEVPPARARTGDISFVARYLLHRLSPHRTITSAALRALSAYAFAGNLIELESVVTRLAISPLDGGNLIDVADIRRHIGDGIGAEPEDQRVSGWKSSREEARREMVLRTIAAAGGDRAEAARRLGITLRALQYHITRAGLSRRRRTRPPPIESMPLVAPIITMPFQST